MDLAGLIEVLKQIQSGAIRCLAVDTPVPSQFAHELLNANPYAYLDEAGLEERRARATNTSRSLPNPPGRLDQARHRHRSPRAAGPTSATSTSCTIFSRRLSPFHSPSSTLATRATGPPSTRGLHGHGRALTADCAGVSCWVATERLPHVAHCFTPTPKLSS